MPLPRKETCHPSPKFVLSLVNGKTAHHVAQARRPMSSPPPPPSPLIQLPRTWFCFLKRASSPLPSPSVPAVVAPVESLSAVPRRGQQHFQPCSCHESLLCGQKVLFQTPIWPGYCPAIDLRTRANSQPSGAGTWCSCPLPTSPPATSYLPSLHCTY